MNSTSNKIGALNQGVFCSHCQMAVMGWQGGTIHQAIKAMREALQRALNPKPVFEFEDIGDEDCQYWLCTITKGAKQFFGAAYVKSFAQARAEAQAKGYL